jgi:hypothetical protein
MRKVCKQKIRKRGLWDGSTWATTYNTGTCFSVSSDDKLVLFLFPVIPTGDPAIVAFYDKRIYKKVTIEVIVPTWPLISRKETASEYDKINNFAMIRQRCDFSQFGKRQFSYGIYNWLVKTMQHIKYCYHAVKLTFNCHKEGGAYHGKVVYFVIFRCCFFPWYKGSRRDNYFNRNFFYICACRRRRL